MPDAIRFAKMHGAGNDFVMVRADDLGGVAPNRSDIAALCHRRLGVGADGLIVIGPADSADADFRMTYYNQDGGEAEMCGNGARCSVAFAHRHGLCAERCRFDTAAGVLSGVVHGPEDIEVSLPAWKDLDPAVALEGAPWSAGGVCNTGVPHLVIEVPDVDAVDLDTWGPRLRHAERFAPAGVNVNWIEPAGADGARRIRTYERGVEAETLACGTGASAAAVILCHRGRAESPVRIETRSGAVLTIGVDAEAGALSLRGPAVTSFTGEANRHDR